MNDIKTSIFADFVNRLKNIHISIMSDYVDIFCLKNNAINIYIYGHNGLAWIRNIPCQAELEIKTKFKDFNSKICRINITFENYKSEKNYFKLIKVAHMDVDFSNLFSLLDIPSEQFKNIEFNYNIENLNIIDYHYFLST